MLLSAAMAASTLVLALIGSAQAQTTALRTEQVTTGLSNPWGMAFLPGGRMLVTERPGRMRVVEPDGKLSAPLTGLPPIAAQGQGGLLDVITDREFASNRTIYFCFNEPGTGDSANIWGTALARAQLSADNRGLENVRVIWRMAKKTSARHHFGCRIVEAADGTLYMGTGDRGAQDRSQDMSDTAGKMIRVNKDGSIPKDNPFLARTGVPGEIFSAGHRNIQGAAINPADGKLWAHEPGPQGGDELNVVEAGKNYGWPVITYGKQYVTGFSIGEGTNKPGMEQPVKTWLPTSIAPSGLAFLTSDRYGAAWKGSVFVGALRERAVIRLQLNGTKVVSEEVLLKDANERIRDIRQGPDGLLYILADDADNGRILRVLPR
ncbi:MAG TPA: PQQ-dependent sugar dehydrogenase [Burkholderiaceae bacterium]|nr:PQQ-dependent sugar dehydrogenase [Burkholderiaceae bacterium]